MASMGASPGGGVSDKFGDKMSEVINMEDKPKYNEWENRRINLILEAGTDKDKILEILNSIYEEGMEDGLNEYPDKCSDREPMHNEGYD